ncbi:SusC/RagA family TonB-linked outer membrane protein [Chryseobacterium taklimakanense]|uniref:SusC/RagA family TonB-linked outer membrane protein n=1 Tax=Chryseobacterium taklimakanense TaxID=536441 RepID=A0A3G8WFP1_9FLAO|nr:SusC/RagA family TonB-linked outer membrane protein [Chryseobacterium taklimakanense]AZI19975.1 SusC/RagA family TonB-linked outer membrane protein [Chryseobacterium taklimakanense]
MKRKLQTIITLVLTGTVAVEMAAQSRLDTIKERKIDEVVVTALGIKREQKALGFSAKKVDEETFEKAQYNNWATAMEGKVAGLKVLTASAGPLETARIKLRGETSMSASDNFALIVIDGIPVDQTLTKGTGSAAYGAGAGGDLPVDYGNILNAINPEDIESVTVLKGASAAALYGERGANGAIMITTKSGKGKNGKLIVGYNSNSSFESVLKWPDWQYEYGQGTQTRDKSGRYYYSYGASADGVNTGSTSSAFGPRFEGQYYFQYDPEVEGQSPERRLWKPYKDNVKGFFNVGTTFSNSISLEAGWRKFNFRTNLNYTDNDWIVPNTGFERFTANNSFGFNFNKLKATAKFIFSNTHSDNLPATGYNNQSLNYFMIFQNPNIDLAWYRPIWKKGKYQEDQIHPFSSFIDNPYMIAYEMTNAINKNNMLGGITLNYQFNNNFEIMLRSGAEYTAEDRAQKRPWSSANYREGYYSEQHINDRVFNNDLLLSYNREFKNLNFKISAGGSMRDTRSETERTNAVGLIEPGIYTFENAKALQVKPIKPYNYKVNSMYGLINLEYLKAIFLDITARNDWTSTLPRKNWSFFYPSVSTSVILSDLMDLNKVDLLKLRASYARSGFGTSPYRLTKYYSPSDYEDSYTMDALLFNADLKPKINTNLEAGLDVAVLKNRLNFNFTFYNNYTENEVFGIPVLVESGYSRKLINSGKVRNRGVELELTGFPFKSKAFTWRIAANWSANKNKVISIPDEFKDEPLGYNYSSVGGAVYFNAVVGGSLGDMYGYNLVRDPQGNVVWGSDGLTAKSTQMAKIGNAFPLWKAGIENSFQIKNVRIQFSFDGQYKGIVYSQTHHKMTEQGKLAHTLKYRDSEDGMMVGEGVVQNADGSYSPNTTRILVSKYYSDYYRRANVETNSFDASYIKLRDARIGYVFPKTITESMKLREMSISLYGKNLWMWTKFPIFDPEAATLDDSDITPGVDIGALPSTRTVGLNFNVKF